MYSKRFGMFDLLSSTWCATANNFKKYSISFLVLIAFSTFSSFSRFGLHSSSSNLFQRTTTGTSSSVKVSSALWTSGRDLRASKIVKGNLTISFVARNIKRLLSTYWYRCIPIRTTVSHFLCIVIKFHWSLMSDKDKYPMRWLFLLQFSYSTT